MRFSRQKYDLGEVGFGFRVAGGLDFLGGEIRPEFSGMAYGRLSTNKLSLNHEFTYGGAAFKSRSEGLGSRVHELSLGVVFSKGPTSLGFYYDWGSEGSADNYAAGISLGYDY